MPSELDQHASNAGVLQAFHPSWLRANCQCAECVDQVSGQRLVSITEQASEVTLASVRETADGLYVTFGPDGHRATFTRSWLAGQAAAETDGRCEDAKQLWSARTFPGGPPVFGWQAYLAMDGVRLAALRHLLSCGFMLLTETGQTPGTVLDVVGTMGYVRETNYGRLFDVRVEATPANLAFTGLPIGPHTDNPYRDPVPTVQLLHCLANATEGGESGLLDGFLAAAMLRDQDPAAFACLTETPVTFCYSDATAELRASRPMIGTRPSGRIHEVRYNGRSMQPVRAGRGRSPAPSADEIGEFYRAYRAFAAILEQNSLKLSFMLNPGDCLVFDNTRVLHSRTGFSAAGSRHLQGCYADLDGIESTVAVLSRSSGG